MSKRYILRSYIIKIKNNIKKMNIYAYNIKEKNSLTDFIDKYFVFALKIYIVLYLNKHNSK